MKAEDEIASLRAAVRRQADFDLPDLLFRKRSGWPGLIATLRAVHDCEARRAYRLALSHKGWRRWVDWRIAHDAECRLQAERELLRHGPGALFCRNGGRLKVRRDMAGPP